MLTKEIYDNYTAILKDELIEALGCTEPIAIAYAAAKAKSVLGRQPERIEIGCSGNIVKNVKGVIVPNTGGLIGIEAAAIAGVIGGDADRELQVLESVRKDQYKEIEKLIKEELLQSLPSQRCRKPLYRSQGLFRQRICRGLYFWISYKYNKNSKKKANNFRETK